MISASPVSAASRRRWLGAWISRFVSVLARNASASSALRPCCTMCSACSSVCRRVRSASSRRRRISGAASRVRSRCEKRSHLCVDQLARFACGLPPALEVVVHDGLQVVDGEQVHVLEFGDVRVDVARHRDIDHEHRPALACAQRVGRHLARDDRGRRRGGGDDDVGFLAGGSGFRRGRSRSRGTPRPVRARGRRCGWR